MKHTPKIDEETLYLEADDAFSALSNLLNRKEKAGGSGGKPTMLEASLFSYLFLILKAPSNSFLDGRLADIAMKYSRLGVWMDNFSREHFPNGILRPPGAYSARR
jgi:hypothetical protein